MPILAHAYQRMCGCAACCRQEEADELDDEIRDDYLYSLTCCQDFIAEVLPNDEEYEAMAAAIKGRDMAELGRIYLLAIKREASEHIEVKANECGITQGEAARRLWDIYRPKIQKVAG